MTTTGPQCPEPRPLTEADLREPLVDLTTLACRGVPGCHAASVTVRLDGGVGTTAATSDIAREIDDVQYNGGGGPCVTSLEQGHVVAVDDYGDDSPWPDVARAAVERGIHSSLSLPLRDGARTFGALNMYADEPHGFGEPSRQIADVLVRQAAAAVRYLELLHSERTTRIAEGQIARALQRSLLPVVPELPGVTCAARYLVGAADAHVGGDWYDVFALPDGALGLAMGDVMGHDVEAAAAMGQLRSVLRSYAYEGISPSAVLDRLDRLVQGFQMAQVATAVYGRLILDKGGAMLLFCNAGHLPPLLRLPDGTVRRLQGASTRMIGVPIEGLGPRTEAAALLPSGSTLLLYTDGLVERRGNDLDEGLNRLCEAFQADPPDASPDDLCDRLLDALLDGEPDDDVAVLAVCIS